MMYDCKLRMCGNHCIICDAESESEHERKRQRHREREMDVHVVCHDVQDEFW